MLSFSPSFDLNYYREIYPELRNMPDDVVKLHYEKYAEVQGRTACIYDRREYLADFLNRNITNEKILEIGPLGRPFLPNKNVKYFDVLDVEGLKQYAKEMGHTCKNFPEKIDFVSPEADLSIVDEKFDIVLSSHSIEHQPNLIKHFEDVEKILNSGGLYVLYIPDKRYCFDHYRPETVTSEVIEACVENQKVHTLKTIIEYKSMTTHNEPAAHWLGIHGSAEIDKEKFMNAIDLYMNSNGTYIDAHVWRFTPRSFEKIIHDLVGLNFIKLKLHRLCHTVWGRQEFCAILKKGN